MMVESKAFDHICAELEAATSFDRLEARGTIRLALREAGLEPRSVSAIQLLIVIARVLPRELESRAVKHCDEVCARLKHSLKSIGNETGADTPEDIFERLGR